MSVAKYVLPVLLGPTQTVRGRNATEPLLMGPKFLTEIRKSGCLPIFVLVSSGILRSLILCSCISLPYILLQTNLTSRVGKTSGLWPNYMAAILPIVVGEAKALSGQSPKLHPRDPPAEGPAVAQFLAFDVALVARRRRMDTSEGDPPQHKEDCADEEDGTMGRAQTQQTHR